VREVLVCGWATSRSIAAGLRLLRELPPGSPHRDSRGPAHLADGREQQLLAAASSVQAPCGGDHTEVVHSVRDIRSSSVPTRPRRCSSDGLTRTKTPLTVILGFTQAIRAGWLDDEKKDDALKSIESRGEGSLSAHRRPAPPDRTDRERASALELDIVPLHDIIEARSGRTRDRVERNFVHDVEDGAPEAIATPRPIPTYPRPASSERVKYTPDGGDIVIRAKGRGGASARVIDHGIA